MKNGIPKPVPWYVGPLKLILTRKAREAIFCKDTHGLGAVRNYWHECPFCGATDLSGEMSVDYDKFPYLFFDE
jgi:hypothetical protein